jgi:hypothetical protein
MTYHGSVMPLHRSSVNVFEKFMRNLSAGDYNFIRGGAVRHKVARKKGDKWII